ncbi:hypothetical protein RUM43_013988 [Polyplax serrata]|uniref:Tumor protein D54 n=1 Tax=Polyplax serrata TaxID=468196 RepID=A0AAN8S6V2_POLSC
MADVAESPKHGAELTDLVNNLDLESDSQADEISFVEDYESLEFEDIYSFVCSTDTPSFDVAYEKEAVEEDDTPLWLIGQQVYNEFQWSDSDQSEIDFEMPPRNEVNKDKDKDSINNNKKSKIKYIKIKSGNIVKKIRINLNDISTYFNKVKRQENYKRFLGTIRRLMDRKANAGDQPPILVSPDEAELQGMTEEEKIETRRKWQEDLAKIEEEIQTLKHVLQSKQRDSQDLKKKLGISVWKELTDDFSQGVKNVKESNVYQNVEEKFSQWGKAVADAPIYQKTESVMKATAESTRSILGGFTQKIGQLKNSESFRSLEEKVGSAYENVKVEGSALNAFLVLIVELASMGVGTP